MLINLQKEKTASPIQWRLSHDFVISSTCT